MLIQIHSIQIPAYWEIIKYGAVKTDNIQPEDIEDYSLNLLHDLLSNKKSCFVHQVDDNVMLMTIITFMVSDLTKKKSLHMLNLYAFSHQNDEVWINALVDLVAIAKKEGCYKLIAESDNDRIQELAKVIQAKHVRNVYEYVVDN